MIQRFSLNSRFPRPDAFCENLRREPDMTVADKNPRRHLLLLISLLFIFIISPFIAPYHYGPTILNVISAAVLLSATYAISERRVSMMIGLSLSTFSIILTFWLAAAPTHWLVI